MAKRQQLQQRNDKLDYISTAALWFLRSKCRKAQIETGTPCLGTSRVQQVIGDGHLGQKGFGWAAWFILKQCWESNPGPCVCQVLYH